MPLAFRTELSSIPFDIPYLKSPAMQTEEWRRRIIETGLPRVGIVWSGNREHSNDSNRSIALRQLGAILELKNVQFISLQKDLRNGDVDELRGHSTVTHIGHELTDFADTAAVISLLDLVVTVDTAVAHLAGAMGKPVWILLPFAPDFRWLLNRDDSPWYPTARLFRQLKVGDWAEVIDRVRDNLRRAVADLRFGSAE